MIAHAATLEKRISRDTIKAAAQLGFGGIYVSGKSGCIRLGRLESALIIYVMASVCPSTPAFHVAKLRCFELEAI